MIKHLFKLIWNRKRTNVLTVVEIFFSFLALFAVAAFGVYYADNSRRPLGFSYDSVWVIELRYAVWTQEVPTPIPKLSLAFPGFFWFFSLGFLYWIV